MGMYRVEWDCCGSVTETDGYLPERCPICERDELAARLAEIEAQQPVGVVEAGEWRTGFGDTSPAVWVKIARDGAGVSVPLGTVLHARPAPAAAPERAEPADPLDWPLPCDVPAGHVTIRKGVALRALVARVEVLTKMVSAAADAPGVRAKAFADCMDRTREARRKMIPCRCGHEGCPDRVSCPRGEQ